MATPDHKHLYRGLAMFKAFPALSGHVHLDTVRPTLNTANLS